MTFQLPELPYALNALAPYISEETLQYHYGKHHQAYVDKLNTLIENTEMADQSLENIIKNSTGPLFNNAAQVWNHTFYWNCLTPEHIPMPSENLLSQINNTFNSLEEFKKIFTETAIATFGSGWAWLVKTPQNTLEIISTSNAKNPMTENKKPLLTCDVWEHAYYIDYRNARAKYLDAFWHLVNWNFIEENFKD